jgi:hypothetical protein
MDYKICIRRPRPSPPPSRTCASSAASPTTGACRSLSISPPFPHTPSCFISLSLSVSLPVSLSVCLHLSFSLFISLSLFLSLSLSLAFSLSLLHLHPRPSVPGYRIFPLPILLLPTLSHYPPSLITHPLSLPTLTPYSHCPLSVCLSRWYPSLPLSL